MALVHCPECGKEVSSNIINCPNCGYKIKKHFSSIDSQQQEGLKRFVEMHGLRRIVWS